MEKKREIQSQREQLFEYLMVCKCTILSHEMKKEEDKFTRILLGYFFEYDNGCEKALNKWDGVIHFCFTCICFRVWSLNELNIEIKNKEEENSNLARGVVMW